MDQHTPVPSTQRRRDTRTNLPRRRMAWVLVTAIALLVAGIVCLAVDHRHTTRRAWQALAMPLALNAGGSVSGEFVADADTTYEVAVQLRWDTPGVDIYETAFATAKPSTLDFRWVVSSDSEVVGSGDCRDYVFLIDRRDSAPIRFAKHVANNPRRQPLLALPVAVRGVGRFQARAGQTYHLRVEAGSDQRALQPAQPMLVVAVDRLTNERHIRRTRPARMAGYAAVTLAAAALVAVGVSAALVRDRRD